MQEIFEEVGDVDTFKSENKGLRVNAALQSPTYPHGYKISLLEFILFLLQRTVGNGIYICYTCFYLNKTSACSDHINPQNSILGDIEFHPRFSGITPR